jgi:serine/threonine protein kinase
MAKRRRTQTGLLLLSWPAVQIQMLDRNISPATLRARSNVSAETWQRVIDEREIRFASGTDLAEALDVPLRALLHPRSLLELAAGFRSLEPGAGLPDWRIDEPCRYGEASNGLKYFVWRLQHRVERNRYARAKQYDVSELRADEQERIADYLGRHGEVCEKVNGVEQFPQHYTVQPDPDGKTWWCLDRWTPGKTLADLVYRGGIPVGGAPRIMRNIAKGLGALHQAGVIYREMTTESVIVVDAERGSVVLTDFEMGKMLDGSPTVRGSRPGNPYQALEVEGKKLTEDDTHVDWYSWGRILLHVVTGGLPPKSQEGPCIEQAELPDRVKEIVAKCLSPEPRSRPRRAKEVLRGIQYWK